MILLRRIHLILGCFFAPMLIFFSVTGMLQLYDIPWKFPHSLLPTLSYIHTGHSSRDPLAWNYTSIFLKAFIMLGATSLILSICLGIGIAFRLKHGRGTLIALALGILVPVILIAIFAHQGND